MNLMEKKLMGKLAATVLDAVNIYPTRLTGKNELQSLIRKLRPISSDKKLIRLGPKGDGGYLVPDDFIGIEACFSPGVGHISGFEKDCADMGMNIFLADNHVEKTPMSHERFHFTRKNIGITTSDEFMTIDDWIKASLSGSQEDLLLQIDIEGYEYETFLGASDSLMNRFRIIVAEFHMLDKLLSQPFFKLASRAFDKILQTHTCVHIHPNNCCGAVKKEELEIPRVAEFTFYRNDRIKNPSFADIFPHTLDYDNTDNPPLFLSECWYKL